MIQLPRPKYKSRYTRFNCCLNLTKTVKGRERGGSHVLAVFPQESGGILNTSHKTGAWWVSESWINKLWEQGRPPPQCQISFSFMQSVPGYQSSSFCQTSSMWWSHFADLCIPPGLPTLSAVPSNAGFSREGRSWGLGCSSISARTWRHFKQVRIRVLFSIKGFVRQRHAGSATKTLGLGQLLWPSWQAECVVVSLAPVKSNARDSKGHWEN